MYICRSVCIHKVARILFEDTGCDFGQALEPEDLKPVAPKLTTGHDLIPFLFLFLFIIRPYCYISSIGLV
jgi:hypothetical protein